MDWQHSHLSFQQNGQLHQLHKATLIKQQYHLKIKMPIEEYILYWLVKNGRLGS